MLPLNRSRRYHDLMDVVLYRAEGLALSLAREPYQSARFLDSIEQLSGMAASLAAQARRGAVHALSPAEVEEAIRTLPDNLVRSLFLAFFFRNLGRAEDAAAQLVRVKDRYEGVPLYQEARARVKGGR